MADSQPRAESWTTFVCKRFFPKWRDGIRARFVAHILGVVLSFLILWAQIHYGVIRWDGIHGRVLSIVGPYALLLLVFVVYHAARTPWIISNDHLDCLRAVELAKTNLEQQIVELKQVPPSVDIRLRELYRFPSKQGRDRNEAGEMSWDIFLNARAELGKPLSATILKYTFQLSLHGKTISIGSEDDVESWEMTIWNPTRVTSTDLPDMPRQLKNGEPAEGWLHFVVGPITYKALDACGIRLVADTGHSCSYGEHQADPLIWNPVREKTFARKG
jgi:hypothetical protein